MLQPRFVETVCDNCGSVVRDKSVGPAEFERIVEELDPQLSGSDRDRSELLADGDLVDAADDVPAEVLVRHVAVCARCSPSA